MKTPKTFFLLGIAMFGAFFVFFSTTGLSLPGSTEAKIGLSTFAMVLASIIVAYRKHKKSRSA